MIGTQNQMGFLFLPPSLRAFGPGEITEAQPISLGIPSWPRPNAQLEKVSHLGIFGVSGFGSGATLVLQFRGY